MSKNALCLTSLVAAIPGAVLAVLSLLSFINYAGGWSFAVKGINALLLVIGASLAAMPVGIFVLAGPKSEKPSKKKDEDLPTEDPSATRSSQVVESDEFATDDEATFEVDESAGEDAFAETIDQAPEEAGSDDFDLGADFDVEEDDKPKKR